MEACISAQLQCDGNMNLVLESNYVAPHRLCAVPQANDPVFGGHDIIYRHALRVLSSMERNNTATISKLGMVLIHVIQHCSLAQQFVNQDAFDPVQLFNDLDNVFIQQTNTR
jgi:hypothetical protein